MGGEKPAIPFKDDHCRRRAELTLIATFRLLMCCRADGSGA
jgi:hypothetical protein